MAIRLAHRLETSQALDFVQLSEKINISKFALPAQAVGQTVVEVNLRNRFGLNIIAIENGGVVEEAVRPDYISAREIFCICPAARRGSTSWRRGSTGNGGQGRGRGLCLLPLSRVGACLSSPPANPAFGLPSCPLSPSPFPSGEGGFLVLLCKGLRPLHPRWLNPGGTYSPCQAKHPAGWLVFFLACQPCF